MFPSSFCRAQKSASGLVFQKKSVFNSSLFPQDRRPVQDSLSKVRFNGVSLSVLFQVYQFGLPTIYLSFSSLSFSYFSYIGNLSKSILSEKRNQTKQKEKSPFGLLPYIGCLLSSQRKLRISSCSRYQMVTLLEKFQWNIF